MRPKIFDHLFNDDRMFVLEISRVKVSSAFPSSEPQIKWAVITRRNVPSYPLHRSDTFNTYEEAKQFYLRIVLETPRVSLDNRSPDPIPTLEQYILWLKEYKLYDPILNPTVEVKKE